MKKMVFAASLLLLMAAASFAQSDKYQIITEKKGPLGLGGKTVMMLDKETGDTWLYQDDKWVLIPKVEEVAAPKEDASSVRDKMNDELNAIKAKQEEELNALKAKYETQINSLSEQKAEINTVPVKQNYRAMKPRHHVLAKKPATAAPASENTDQGSGDEAPPAWLND